MCPIQERGYQVLEALYGLEEIYEKHNEEHGTNHQCKFLPNFHPELVVKTQVVTTKVCRRKIREAATVDGDRIGEG
jgi:hypothetical protein